MFPTFLQLEKQMIQEFEIARPLDDTLFVLCEWMCCKQQALFLSIGSVMSLAGVCVCLLQIFVTALYRSWAWLLAMLELSDREFNSRNNV